MIGCPTCRNQVQDNSITCPFCGTRLVAKEAMPKTRPLAAPQGQQPWAQVQPPAEGQPSPPWPPPQSPPGQPPQPGYPPYGQSGKQQYAGVSPKKRNKVILLCFFLGLIGAHRFYLGKIVTAILMIITLGGLGIWWVIDFFISIFGNYKDSLKRPVDKKYNKPIAIMFIVLFLAVPVLLTLAIALPHYAKLKDIEITKHAEAAFKEVINAEEAYFAENSEFTPDYQVLVEKSGLIMDPEIDYGEIELIFSNPAGLPGYKFKLSAKKKPDQVLEYDSFHKPGRDK